MTGSNVMGKASVVSSEKGGLVLGAGLSDAGPLASPLPCLLRLTWKRHQSASGRLEWRGGRFGLGWIQATAMLWAGFPTWACLSPGPDYSAITKHPKSKSTHACHSPPAPCLGACTRRSLAIAFRQSHYSVGRSAADSTMYLRSILLVLTSYYMLDTCVLHRLLYPLDTFTLSPPCICILLSCTHTHTHSRSPLHVTSDAPCFP
ncbi:hypothetical protein COCCADRAFT_32478 [Bipolaris zeicola 26-R-13]|uniref:Uncharacterized protein n=1 Tax=Cochliobolus carbonum (strain 26-R-13) TaxID=930089 RepID=W6Z4E0_COCC2|nr:uncharacterized protein COCCADRAFT_32478 [Bipolaris zeicola 26-R-13]EUC38556.1 hypothetical protein COCCADRAFT_32478 [Bipolaris zeicola 26-R-13]